MKRTTTIRQQEENVTREPFLRATLKIISIIIIIKLKITIP